MEIPAWSEIFKAAPLATIICFIVFFGHWLRNAEVKRQDEHLIYLKHLLELKRGNGA